MANVLLTLAEEVDQTTENHFAVRYPVDEYDCFDFANGFKELGHHVYFINWRDLDFETSRAVRMFSDNEKRFVDPLPIAAFDVAFVYKMEGFLFNVPRFWEMVSLFERQCAVVVNHPDTIRHNINKSYVWQLAAKGVRCPQTFAIGPEVHEKLSRGEKLVLKPMCAERGYGAKLVQSLDALQEIAGLEEQYLAQEYLPEIRDGERSLAFLGFQFEHAVIKKPSRSQPQEFRCNDSLGGTVEVYHPTDEELEYAVSVLRTYESFGCPVHFSRVDFVNGARGPILIEAELLNPSIYANTSKLGQHFGRRIANYFQTLISAASPAISMR